MNYRKTENFSKVLLGLLNKKHLNTSRMFFAHVLTWKFCVRASETRLKVPLLNMNMNVINLSRAISDNTCTKIYSTGENNYLNPPPEYMTRIKRVYQGTTRPARCVLGPNPSSSTFLDVFLPSNLSRYRRDKHRGSPLRSWWR